MPTRGGRKTQEEIFRELSGTGAYGMWNERFGRSETDKIRQQRGDWNYINANSFADSSNPYWDTSTLTPSQQFMLQQTGAYRPTSAFTEGRQSYTYSTGHWDSPTEETRQESFEDFERRTGRAAVELNPEYAALIQEFRGASPDSWNAPGTETAAPSGGRPATTTEPPVRGRPAAPDPIRRGQQQTSLITGGPAGTGVQAGFGSSGQVTEDALGGGTRRRRRGFGTEVSLLGE